VISHSVFWGKPLSEELDAIFSRRSIFCVLFVSEHYTRSRWALAELQDAARTKRRDYIPPMRLDATTLEGLPDDIVYVPIEKGSDAICSYIIEKLRRA